MTEIELNSWEEYREKIGEIQKQREEMAKGKDRTYVSPLLFRGQSDAEWSLKTTLERENPTEVEMSEYHRIINYIKPRIESATGKEWSLKNSDEFSEWIQNQNRSEAGFLFVDEIPCYEYMVYLRHHGFPSPLLDWTSSPYIAAHFAFRRAKEKSTQVAIFAFGEYGGRGKMHSGDLPIISSLNPNIKTHNRHYLQQSCYTICTTRRGNNYFYANHEEAILNSERYDQDQDVIWKFIMPSSECEKAYYDLTNFNINAFSLFASEESLMETLAKEVITKFLANQ